MLSLDKRRILFLDLDGVINNHSERTYGQSRHVMRLRSKNIPNASLDNVVPLTELCVFCYEHGIEIVITSAWNIAGFQSCYNAMLEIVGRLIAEKVFVDCTRYSHDLPEPVRSNEIDEWMSTRKIDRYCIVDDYDDFSDKHKEFWIKIDGEFGLTNKNVKEIKKMLTK